MSAQATSKKTGLFGLFPALNWCVVIDHVLYIWLAFCCLGGCPASVEASLFLREIWGTPLQEDVYACSLAISMLACSSPLAIRLLLPVHAWRIVLVLVTRVDRESLFGQVPWHDRGVVKFAAAAAARPPLGPKVI